MKTIRLRRPTDIPPAPNAISSAETRLKPAPAPAAPVDAAPAPAAPAPAAPADAAPAEAPAEVAPVKDIGVDAEPVTAATAAADSAEPSVTVTQKKTLKLKRPNFKRPTVGGLRKPGATAAAPAASADAQSESVADMGAVADIPTVADIPDIRPLPTPMPAAEDDSKTVAGTPSWLNAITLVAGLAALAAAGLCTWSLYTQAVGPEAGPNGLASFYSETDHSR